MSSYQYRKSHCGDKRVVRSSYLHSGISYSGKMTSLYWIRAQDTSVAQWHALHSFTVICALYNRACHPGGHCWDYWSGALSISQVTARHLKIRHPQISCVGTWSWNELQWFVKYDTSGLFYYHGLTLIPAWICNHMRWNYLFPNFHGCTIEVWEWINKFIPLFKMDVITSLCWY